MSVPSKRLESAFMTPSFSCYLDIVRVGAAFVVLMSHAWETFLPSRPLAWPGHQAVVVFFVLSGLVIAYVRSEKEKDLQTFALARIFRLLPVTIPALALSIVVAWQVHLPLRHELQAAALNLFFLAQSWSESALMATNAPYWSLCYEAWYYAIFAAATFPGTTRSRIAWMSFACLIAGPKILLLMPCWLCGVALYTWREKLRLSPASAVALFAATIVAYLCFSKFDVSIHIRESLHNLTPGFINWTSASNQFVGDFLLALIVSANFVAVRSLTGFASRLLADCRPLANRVASVTLSLYLFHAPVIAYIAHAGIRNPLIAMPLTIAVPSLLAWFTELRRRNLRRFIASRLAVKLVPRATRIPEVVVDQ